MGWGVVEGGVIEQCECVTNQRGKAVAVLVNISNTNSLRKTATTTTTTLDSDSTHNIYLMPISQTPLIAYQSCLYHTVH